MRVESLRWSLSHGDHHLLFSLPEDRTRPEASADLIEAPLNAIFINFKNNTRLHRIVPGEATASCHPVLQTAIADPDASADLTEPLWNHELSDSQKNVGLHTLKLSEHRPHSLPRGGIHSYSFRPPVRHR